MFLFPCSPELFDRWFRIMAAGTTVRAQCEVRRAKAASQPAGKPGQHYVHCPSPRAPLQSARWMGAGEGRTVQTERAPVPPVPAQQPHRTGGVVTRCAGQSRRFPRTAPPRRHRHPTPDTDTDTDTDTDFRPTPSMSSSPAPSNKPTPCNSFEYPPQPTYSPPPDNARKGKPGWSGRRQASTCYRVAQWGARSPLRVPCLAGRCGPGSVRECGE